MKCKFINDSTALFVGLYESYLFHSDTLLNYESMDELDTEKEGYDIDNWDNYVYDVGKLAVGLLHDYCSNGEIIKEISYVGIVSPRYYNFSTDRLAMTVDVNMTKLKSFCLRDNVSNFENYLKQYYTSYDGYYSSIPNTVQGFKEEYKLGDRDSCISVMLEYYMLTCLYETTDLRELDNNTEYDYRLNEENFELLYNHLTKVYVTDNENETGWTTEKPKAANYQEMGIIKIA